MCVVFVRVYMYVCVHVAVYLVGMCIILWTSMLSCDYHVMLSCDVIMWRYHGCYHVMLSCDYHVMLSCDYHVTIMWCYHVTLSCDAIMWRSCDYHVTVVNPRCVKAHTTGARSLDGTHLLDQQQLKSCVLSFTFYVTFFLHHSRRVQSLKESSRPKLYLSRNIRALSEERDYELEDR